MSVEIIATPGAPDANSYVTAAEATAFFAKQYGFGTWASALDDDQRAQLLIMATEDIDGEKFVGNKMFPRYSELGQEQALKFPRRSTQVRQKRHEFISVTLSSASTDTSLISSDLINHSYYPDDFWNGGSVLVTSGDYQFEIRRITDFVRATGTLTTEAFSGSLGSVSAWVVGPIPKEIKECTFWQAWYNYQEGGRISARREVQAQGLVEMSHHGGARETYIGRASRSAAPQPTNLHPKVSDILSSLGWIDNSVTLIPVD
jgi:hypothetical protein